MLTKVARRLHVALVRATLVFRPRLTVVVVGNQHGDATDELREAARRTRSVQLVETADARAGVRARGAFVAFVGANESTRTDWLLAVADQEYRGRGFVPVPRKASKLGARRRVALAATIPESAFLRSDVRRILRRRATSESAAAARTLVATSVRRAPSELRLAPVPSAPAPAMATAAVESAAATLQAAAAVPAGPDAPSLRADIAYVAAQRAGQALRGSPLDRVAVLTQLQELAPFADLTRALNAGMAETLVVAYAFPPYLDTSGFVAARRLALEGRPYDVLTKDLTGERAVDHESLELARDLMGRCMTVRGRTGFGSWKAIDLFCRRGLELVEQREDASGPYERLYSRSMWPAATVLGAVYKARHPDVTWVAELSDPLRVRTDGTYREYQLPGDGFIAEIAAAAESRGVALWNEAGVFDAIEWMAYTFADEIVFTNENQRELMLTTFPDRDAAARADLVSRVSHHPTPEPKEYQRAQPVPTLPRDRVNVAYFGRFYGVRSVEDLLAPFSRLSAAERDQVCLSIFTPDAEEVRSALGGHPAANCTIVHDTLPYFQFLATTRAVDWLLVADSHTRDVFPANPYLPSKLADYRGSGTPIWALVEPGSVLSHEPLNAVSELGDIEAAVSVLRSAILRVSDPS